MPNIITVGSAVQDVFLVSKAIKLIKDPRFETGIGECLALGAKIDVDSLTLTTGGGATNAAATFGGLGFNVSAIGRIGNDPSGQAVLNDLRSFKVQTSLMKTIKNGETGYSVLLTEPKNGERTVLVYRGVSAEFTERDIPWTKLTSDWIYMTSLAGATNVAARVVKTAAKRGTKVVWNPGSGELKKGMKIFKPLLPHLTILNMNREEAKHLFKKDLVPQLGNGKILKQVPPTLTLIITDGPAGAYTYLDGTVWFIEPQNTPVVSRTGAGDAFGSGITAGLMKGWGIDDAMRLGLLNSQSVIASYGAKHGILKRWPSKKSLTNITVRQM